MSRDEGGDRYILHADWKLERKTSIGRPRFKWERVEDLEWVRLAQDGVQWCAVVYTLTNFEFHKRLGMFLGT